MAEIPDWDTRILHSRWTNHQCGFRLCLMKVSCPSPEYKVIITYRWEKALGCPCHAQLDVRAALSLLSYLAKSPPSMDPRPMHCCRYCSPPQGSRLSSTSNQSSSKPFPSSRVLQDSLTEQLQVLKAGLLTRPHQPDTLIASGLHLFAWSHCKRQLFPTCWDRVDGAAGYPLSQSVTWSHIETSQNETVKI